MASVVGIVNRALVLLNEEPITALTDNTPSARQANLIYPSTRDAFLRDHVWNAALARATLAKLAAAPAWGFASAFQLPADPYCLRALALEDATVAWKIEGRALLTDAGAANLLYVKRIEDPAEFDALMIDALSARLAADLGYPVTGSRTIAADMMTLYLAKVARAKTVDAQEGTTDNRPTDAWNAARR